MFCCFSGCILSFSVLNKRLAEKGVPKMTYMYLAWSGMLNVNSVKSTNDRPCILDKSGALTGTITQSALSEVNTRVVAATM